MEAADPEHTTAELALVNGMITLDLSNIDQRSFLSILSKASRSSQADNQGVWSTISTLLTKASEPFPSFIADAHTVVAHGVTCPDAAEEYLKELTLTAHEAATAVLRASVLSQGSEGDEYSDFGVFVGEVDIDANGAKASAERVLNSLGLGGWLTSGEIQIVKSLDSSNLPTAMNPKAIAPFQQEGSTQAIAQLGQQLGHLSNRFEFRIEGLTPGPIIHFLLGRGEGGWQGLGSASTWSDD